MTGHRSVGAGRQNYSPCAFRITGRLRTFTPVMREYNDRTPHRLMPLTSRHTRSRRAWQDALANPGGSEPPPPPTPDLILTGVADPDPTGDFFLFYDVPPWRYYVNDPATAYVYGTTEEAYWYVEMLEPPSTYYWFFGYAAQPWGLYEPIAPATGQLTATPP